MSATGKAAAGPSLASGQQLFWGWGGAIFGVGDEQLLPSFGQQMIVADDAVDHDAAFQGAQRDAVPENDSVAQHGGYPFARGEDAHQVQRVACGYGDKPAIWFPASRSPQRLYSFWQSELLSDKTADKAATTDFAPGFQSP